MAHITQWGKKPGNNLKIMIKAGQLKLVLPPLKYRVWP